jgi:hypothetical protein
MNARFNDRQRAVSFISTGATRFMYTSSRITRRRMDLINAILSFGAVVGAVAAIISFIHARTGVAVSWLCGVALVVGAIALLFRAGLEPVATGVSLVSALIGSFRFFKERSVSVRLLIAIAIGLILLVLAWIVYLIFAIMNALAVAIAKGFVDAFFKSLTPAKH